MNCAAPPPQIPDSGSWYTVTGNRKMPLSFWSESAASDGNLRNDNCSLQKFLFRLFEFSDCHGNGHHQACGEGFGGHAGHSGEAGGLGGEIGDMDESAQSFLSAVGKEIHEAVEKMIAYEGAGGI